MRITINLLGFVWLACGVYAYFKRKDLLLLMIFLAALHTTFRFSFDIGGKANGNMPHM